MLTIVTRVKLREGGAERWDRAMHARVQAARDRSGWVTAQLLKPVDEPLQRAIIGTWRSRDDWAAWHDDATFRETREDLSGLEEGPAETVWYEVVDVLTEGSGGR